jgi:glycosyltransferase involved in cell wall biosynthesis
MRRPWNERGGPAARGRRDGGPARRLRVAMVMPPWYEVPPAGYGGLERVCASLIDGLVSRGHQVTLYGAGTRTGTRARFVSTHPELRYPRLLEALPELVHVTAANDLLARGGFDIVHDHTTVGPVTAAQRPVPSVVTVHGRPTGDLGAYLSRVDDAVALVAISHAQRRAAPHLSWFGTVHHGIEIDTGAKSEPATGPVLWLGRFDPDKGPDTAIAACRAAGLPLVLAGKCHQPDEWSYLEEVVRPLLVGADVELLVNADRVATDALLSQARSLIMPIRWDEPFGMVMIEAMARGTPVVALRRGSVPEVVRDGRTGFVCGDESELPAALAATDLIDPAACVAHVASAFSADLMARRYEALYRDLLVRSTPVSAARRGVPARAHPAR